MVNLIGMRSVEYPTNALLDVPNLLAPATNALLNYTRGVNAAEQTKYDRGRQAVVDGRESARFAQQQKQWKQEDVQRMGQRALAISQMPDTDPAKAVAWKQWLDEHGPGDHTPEELNPATGPKIAAAKAGEFAGGQALKTFEVGGRLVSVGPSGQTREIYAAPEKPDPVRDMLMRRLGGGQQQTQPQAPTVQPQSFTPMDQRGPRLQNVADVAPQQPQSAPQPDTVETPYGRMTRQEARELGGAMLLDPKYSAAGKAILETLDGAAGAGISKPAATQLDERTISAASTLGRLQEIRKQFKPEFLQIPNKLKLAGASWGAAMGGKLSPEITSQLRDFARFKVVGFDNFNQLLKELSGTAVSAQELARQKIVQPNPGEGIFDGDDPETFMAKIDQGERIAKAAMARMNFMRSKGLAFNKDTAEQFMRLEDVPAAIEQRGAELENQLRQQNPKADPMVIEKTVRDTLRQEFGI